MAEPWRRVAHECLAPLWAALEVDCSLFPYTCLALLSWGALTGKRFGRIDAVSEVQVYCTSSWSHCSGNVIYIRDTYSALILGEDLWQPFTARKRDQYFVKRGKDRDEDHHTGQLEGRQDYHGEGRGLEKLLFTWTEVQPSWSRSCWRRLGQGRASTLRM